MEFGQWRECVDLSQDDMSIISGVREPIPIDKGLITLPGTDHGSRQIDSFVLGTVAID